MSTVNTTTNRYADYWAGQDTLTGILKKASIRSIKAEEHFPPRPIEPLNPPDDYDHEAVLERWKASLFMYTPHNGSVKAGDPIAQPPVSLSGFMAADLDSDTSTTALEDAATLRALPTTVAAYVTASGTSIHVIMQYGIEDLARLAAAPSDYFKAAWEPTIEAWHATLPIDIRNGYKLAMSVGSVLHRFHLPPITKAEAVCNLNAEPIPLVEPSTDPEPARTGEYQSDPLCSEATAADFGLVVGESGWTEKNQACPLGHSKRGTELMFGRFKSTGDLFVKCVGKHSNNCLLYTSPSPRDS